MADQLRTNAVVPEAARQETGPFASQGLLTYMSSAAVSDRTSSIERLLVLVPNVEGLETELARRVWLLASPSGLNVTYLSVIDHFADEPLARRRLATLAALTRDARTRVETSVSVAGDWLHAVRRIWTPRDLVVCLSEHVAAARRRGQPSLDLALASDLNAQVYLLSGAYPERGHLTRPWLARTVPATLPYAIVAMAFLLQVQIARLPRDWVYYILMSLSVLGEAGLIVLSVSLRD